MKNKLSQLQSPILRDIFKLFVIILLIISPFVNQRQKNIAHFINDRRNHQRHLPALMFGTTLTFTSVTIWGTALYNPSVFSAVMVAFHTATLFVIYKTKPYLIKTK